MLKEKRSGILLHISSLPSKFGVGDLGRVAYRFADLLSENGQRYWQVLPLTPTCIEGGNSPYNSDSAFAGNKIFISPETLFKDGLLDRTAINNTNDLARTNYKAAYSIKNKIIIKAYGKFKKTKNHRSDYERFCSDNSYWLNDYAIYKAILQKSGKPWYVWEPNLRDHKPGALADISKQLKEIVELEKFTQFIVFRQWHLLKDYCNKKEIRIIGDLPFYVNHNSADVWANSEIFKLDTKKRPTHVGGVPPDYFSKTGQLWGNPVYDWNKMRGTGFTWLIDRIGHNMKMYDILRLDHFRGFSAYWEVAANKRTAIGGRWVKTASEDFFKVCARNFPNLPFIAEDLGVITPDVRKMMDKLRIPGMRVLLFAFDGSPDNINLPHNYQHNCVAYTGTHDTNTAKGWFLNESSKTERETLFRYVGRKFGENDVSWEMIRLAMTSVSNLCIIPMQDILCLGEEARMNYPSKVQNNWVWKMTEEDLRTNKYNRLRKITEITGRS